MVAGDASAHMTTSMGNTIATKHLHLVMRVLAGGSPSARSKHLLASATLHMAGIVCGNIKFLLTTKSNHLTG